MLKLKSETSRILAILCLPVLMTACGKNPAAVSVTDNGSGSGAATVQSTILLGKVGALSKSATINLRKLILTAVSSATPTDTVYDSSVVSGNDAVTVTRNLTLKPLRNWIVSAKTLDQLDSVIHSGSSSSFFVKASDTVGVTLNLSSRFSMYQANFNTLPDSISSTLSGTGKDKLNLNRLVLKVDGVIKSDSVLASGYYSGGQNVSEFFDYVTTGTHTVTLEAYGIMHTYTGLLYSGTSTFTVAAGVDDTKSVTLGWVGPTTGTGKLTVTLGKVGKVIVNGSVPGAVF